MQTTLHIETTVLPGNRVEFSSPQLPEGARVEVTVVAEQPAQPMISMIDLVKTLPPGPRAFATWEEYERFLEEKKSRGIVKRAVWRLGVIPSGRSSEITGEQLP